MYIDKTLPTTTDGPVKVPARLVLNNSTIALYSDEEYTNNIFTFRLPLVSISKDQRDVCCFLIKSNNKKFSICAFDKQCGTKTNPLFFNEWNREFNLFKSSCYEGVGHGPGKDPLPGQKPGIGTNGSINDLIKTSVAYSQSIEKNKVMQQAQVQMVNEREKLLEQKLATVQNNKVQTKIGNTQKTVFRALRKEVKLEDMIKEEQAEKFQDETRALIQKYKHEKKKKKCLEKILKKREEEDAKVREQFEVKHEIAKLKEDAVRAVRQKRKTLKKKIAQLKKQMKRRNRIIEQKIQRVRGSMASELMMANKMGDMSVCLKSRNSKNLITQYCDGNFIDDYAKNNECKDPDNFCYVCCENEFGNMYLKKRDECYQMCDHKDKKDPVESGEWVWHNDILAGDNGLYPTYGPGAPQSGPKPPATKPKH